MSGEPPVEAGPPASGVLDAAALARLRELDPQGHTGLVERVMRAFDTSARRLLGLLRDARARQDHAGIRHVVHTLKSSSASIGALHLSRLCAEIESMIRNDRTEGLDAHVDAMEIELDVVLKALHPMLGPTP